MRRFVLLVIFSVLAGAGSAHASGLPFDECFTNASARFGINKRLLVAIAQTESKLNPNVPAPRNVNGSYDIGIMQINSVWLASLAKWSISEQDLKAACTNIHVGAWILAKNIDAHGSTWKAVGAYNASTTSKQVNYVNKVQQNYELVGSLLQ